MLIRQGIGGSQTIELGRKRYQYWLIETKGVKDSKFRRMYTVRPTLQREETGRERGGRRERDY